MNVIDRISYEFRKGNSAIRQIILINLLVFVCSLLVNLFAHLMGSDGSTLLRYFYLPSDLSELVIRPWTLLTHIFFHDSHSVFHILWNMLILYFIGRILQDFLKRQQLWSIFLLGGITGGLFFVTAANVFPVFNDAMILLGASGGVTAIVVAAGMYLPTYIVRLFGVYPIELRFVAIGLVLLDLLSIPSSANAGGLIAHLGGALFGALYILELRGRIRLPSFRFASPQKRKMKPVHFDESKRKVRKDRSEPDQERIDAILDKISQSGYSSLSKEEKEILFKASE